MAMLAAATKKKLVADRNVDQVLSFPNKWQLFGIIFLSNSFTAVCSCAKYIHSD